MTACGVDDVETTGVETEDSETIDADVDASRVDLFWLLESGANTFDLLFLYMVLALVMPTLTKITEKS